MSDFYVYRVNYASKASFESAMMNKGVLVEIEGEKVNAPTALSVVHLGFAELKKAVLDEQGDVVEPAVVADGYLADIKVTQPLTFSKEIAPDIATPIHGLKWAEGAKNL